MEQLSLDFSGSSAQRRRKAAKIAAESTQATLFSAWSPNLDVHLHSPTEAVVTVTGPEPERAEHWLAGIVGSVRVIRTRRLAFPVDKLDRLLYLRAPAHVTLDAATTAVARALWAQSLGLKPLQVTKQSGRLIASSVRWPTGLGVKDVPWTAIAALVQAGVSLDVDSDAQVLLDRRLRESGATIAVASLAGSAVSIQTSRPELLERLLLPALAYDGGSSTGRYKMPLLAAQPLLTQPLVKVPDSLAKQIRKATGPVKPLETGPDFPWTLYGFQAVDAGKALRILRTTGGVLLAGEMGSGKCQPLTAPVLTPTGWRPIGDLQAGDPVMGTDGSHYQVRGVYRQGVKEIFNVTLSDKSVVQCSEEHLWQVTERFDRQAGRPSKTLTLREIIAGGVKTKDGAKYWLPEIAPQDFGSNFQPPVDPYVLGVWLGDGRCEGSGMTPQFCGVDEEIASEVRTLLPECLELRQKAPAYAVSRWSICAPRGVRNNAFTAELRRTGLASLLSYEKFIPGEYLTASIEDRLALLQGLMDTDGSHGAGKSPVARFCSTSWELCDGVAFLVRSLGGKATVTVHVKEGTTYVYNGETRPKRGAWLVHMHLPPDIQLFRLPRKRDRYRIPNHGRQRNIVKVEPAGREETVCISVSSPDRLYLTSGMTPVHNTTVGLSLINEMSLWPLLVISPLSGFSTWDRQLRELNKDVFLATTPPSHSWTEIEKGTHDAVVISYDRLHSFTELIERMHFKAAIADEVQRVRTPGSRRSRALRSLAGAIPFRIGLSGTPMVNGLTDLLPIGAWISPGEWKPRASDKELTDLYPGDPVDSVADHLGSMMVRRRMEDAVTNMPKRNDHRVFVQLTVEQRKALRDLEEEARLAKESGEFDGPNSKFHAFTRLQQMRKIVNCPASAGVPGPNPKVRSALDLAQDFISMGRKGVIFTADRTSFVEIGKGLDALGIGWVGLWGSTPPDDRIKNEHRFHTDPKIKVVVCTIQAGSESWSASPTATWLVSTSYVYAPATLDQMAARVHRMNSDPDGPEIEVMSLHAQADGGTLDDRMLEILAVKRQLFSQVVDRQNFVDNTNVHYSMSDLLFLMTGEHDEKRIKAEKDNKATQAKERAKAKNAKNTLYKKKGRNKTSADIGADDGEWALTLEQWEAEADTATDTEESEAYDAGE